MQPGAAVESGDVINHVFSGLGLIGIGMLPARLHLEIQEEAFCYGAIPTIGPATHAVDKTVPGQ